MLRREPGEFDVRNAANLFMVSAVSELNRRAFLARAGAAGAAVLATGVPSALVPSSAEAAVRFPSSWTRELMNELRGGVYVQNNPRYHFSAPVFNTRFDQAYPPAIARPVDVADVQTALAWAARHDVQVVPRGGGHGYTGNSASSHALVLDLRTIKGVALRDGGTRAQIGGGTLAIDAVAALAPSGVTVATGSCPSVGLAGFSMGGGIGSLTRAHGLGADRLESVTLVTADGRLVTASATEHPDLFWALRGGGGGNLGILTSATYRTIPTVAETAIAIRFPWDAADDVLDTFLRFAPDAPRELSGDLAFGVDSARKPPAVRYDGTFLGPETAARTALAPLLAIDGAVASLRPTTHLAAVKAAGYCETLSIGQCRPARFGDNGALGRARFFAGSSYLSGPLDAAGRAALLRAVRTATPVFDGRRSVLLAALGGAIDDMASSGTAYPHRGAAVNVQFYAKSSGLWEDYNARNWVKSARRHLAPHTTGGAYVNYLDRDQADWREAFYGDSLERLQAAKAEFDPELRFEPRQGIPLPT